MTHLTDRAERISTGGAEFPVHLPALRPLTLDQAAAAVADSLASLLRVLVDLPPDYLTAFSANVGASARRLVGTSAEPFRPAFQVLQLLAAVIDAHPDAAALLADHLQEN